MLQRRVGIGKAIEIGAGEDAHPRVGERGDGVTGGRAEGAADKIGRVDHADDLLAAVEGVRVVSLGDMLGAALGAFYFQWTPWLIENTRAVDLSWVYKF